MTVEFDGKRYEQTSAHQKEWGTRLIKELNLRGDEHMGEFLEENHADGR